MSAYQILNVIKIKLAESEIKDAAPQCNKCLKIKWNITSTYHDYMCYFTDYTDYSAAFYTYDILLGISAITIILLPLGAQLPADNIMRDLLRIVRLPPVLLFIFFLFALGNFWGFIESFLFLYLKELGASNYLLGM